MLALKLKGNTLRFSICYETTGLGA